MMKVVKAQTQAILQQVAKEHRTTEDEVRKEIRKAMVAGMLSRDPAVQEEWRKIPHEGEYLTEDDFLIYLIEKTKSHK